VIDCRGHLLGRLASIVSKELLKGQNVVCLRAEEIITSGSIYRNKSTLQCVVIAGSLEQRSMFILVLLLGQLIVGQL